MATRYTKQIVKARIEVLKRQVESLGLKDANGKPISITTQVQGYEKGTFYTVYMNNDWKLVSGYGAEVVLAMEAVGNLIYAMQRVQTATCAAEVPACQELEGESLTDRSTVD